MTYTTTVLSSVLKCVDCDLKVTVPFFVQINKGRFAGSVGRVVNLIETPPKYGNKPTYHMMVEFEKDGRAYKHNCWDYGYDAYVITDANEYVYHKVDKERRTKIPTLKDKYGLDVTVGALAVVHTNYGLKLGHVKKITPGATVRFRDFDNKNAEFTKQLMAGSENRDIMILTRDIMDQLMLRRLSS